MNLRSIYNDFKLFKLRRRLYKVKSYRNEFKVCSDSNLKEVFESFRYLENKEKVLEKCIALGVESIHRVLGIEVYDEQILCALGMSLGYICELKTGEGKTLVLSMVSIYRALFGNVTVVTVNDVLAVRDFEYLKEVYSLLGISSCVNPAGFEKNIKVIFSNDVIYSSSSNIIFDYLRDELNNIEPKFVKLDSVVIDEADFVLLDNANSDFSVSCGSNVTSFCKDSYIIAYEIVKLLKGGEECRNVLNENIKFNYDEDCDFIYCIDSKTCYLTKKGMEFIEDYLHVNNITVDMTQLYGALIDTLEVNVFYIKDRDYVVYGENVYWINRENGRVEENTKRDKGIQTAVEVKENVKVTEFKYGSCVNLSYQIYFNKYKFITGASGTIKGSELEFSEIFNKDCICIPEHNKSKRVDHGDKVFKNKEDKYNYLVTLVNDIHSKGQPVLIISSCDRDVTDIKNNLDRKGISFNILNNNNSFNEDEVISKVGEVNSVTVSTNMLGRGTDILVSKEAESLGGLYIICLGHYHSIRIDNQIKGRTGRQGSRGETICLVSLEDDLFNYLLEKDLLYIRSIDDITDKRDQRYVRKLIKKAQDVQESTRAVDRIKFYKMNRLIEDYRNYIRLHKFIEHDYVSFFRSYALNHTLESYFDAFNSRLIKFGDDVSNNLLKEILNNVIKDTWGECKYEILELREYVHLEARLKGENSFLYFVRTSNDIICGYIEFLCNESLKYFLSAYIKNESEEINVEEIN